MLSCKRLSVVKGERPVLREIEFNCDGGQCVAILGENGAGKSVLLRSLALVENGAFGEVTVLGESYRLDGHAPAAGPWPDLSIVLQSIALWPHLTAEENIRLPWARRDAAARLSDDALMNMLRRLELLDLLVRYPSELSGGQRQRIAIARLFAVKPQVILLDEPSAAMDARQSLLLLALLEEQKRAGVSIIFATHNLGFADKLADEYVFVHEGEAIDGGYWGSLLGSSSSEVQSYLRLNAFR